MVSPYAGAVLCNYFFTAKLRKMGPRKCASDPTAEVGRREMEE
jgi:hypothetical protein